MERFLVVIKNYLPWFLLIFMTSVQASAIFLIFDHLQLIKEQTASISEVTSQVFVTDKKFGFCPALRSTL